MVNGNGNCNSNRNGSKTHNVAHMPQPLHNRANKTGDLRIPHRVVMGVASIARILLFRTVGKTNISASKLEVYDVSPGLPPCWHARGRRLLRALQTNITYFVP